MKHKIFLVALFLFSLFIHSAFFCLFFKKERDYFVPKDSMQYHTLAQQIAKGNGISYEDGRPNFYRVPGYSIFLSLWYRLFDFDIQKTIWVQIFIAAFIPLLVFFLSLTLFPQKILVAKVAAIIMSCNLGFLVHAGLLMSEILFIFFFLLFFIYFFSFDIKKMFWSGLFLGTASLIRPVGHFVLIVAFFILLFSCIRGLQKCKATVFLFFGWISIVVWWLLRNYLLTGSLFFHVMPGYHLLYYFAAEVNSKVCKCTYPESKQKLLKRWEALIEKREKKMGYELNEIKRCVLAQKIAMGVLKEHFFVTMKLSCINILKTIFGLHSVFFLYRFSSYFPHYTSSTTMWQRAKHFLFPRVSSIWIAGIMYLEMIVFFLILVGFVGVIILSFFDKVLMLQFLRVALFIFLLIFLTFGSGVARLRMPIEPFLIIFSVYFWRKSYEVVSDRILENCSHPF
jgi:hypothetical protein